MPVISVPPYAMGDILKVRVLCQDGPQIGMNILHYQVVSAAGPSPTLAEMVKGVTADLQGIYKVLMSSKSTFRGCGLQRIYPTTDLEGVDLTQLGPGTQGTVPAPPQVSMYLTTYVGGAGRKNRGRVYVPFMSSDYLGTDGTLNVLGQTALDGLGRHMVDSLTITGAAAGSRGITPVLWNRKAKTAQVINNYRVNTNLGTQVRRSFTHRPDVVPF